MLVNLASHVSMTVWDYTFTAHVYNFFFYEVELGIILIVQFVTPVNSVLDLWNDHCHKGK